MWTVLASGMSSVRQAFLSRKLWRKLSATQETEGGPENHWAGLDDAFLLKTIIVRDSSL